MGFYSYIRKIGNVGVGTENLGFMQPTTLPAYDGWLRPRYMVRASLDPQHSAYVKEQQFFQPVSLVGNGSALSGQFALQALAQLKSGK